MAAIRPLSELEFRDAVGFVAYQLERGEISRTLAASDLRRLVAGRAMQERTGETRRRVFEALSPSTQTPFDLGVARFAADVADLLSPDPDRKYDAERNGDVPSRLDRLIEAVPWIPARYRRACGESDL